MLLDDGGVKCWGGIGYGQVGLGDMGALGDGEGEMGDVLPLWTWVLACGRQRWWLGVFTRTRCLLSAVEIPTAR